MMLKPSAIESAVKGCPVHKLLAGDWVDPLSCTHLSGYENARVMFARVKSARLTPQGFEIWYEAENADRETGWGEEPFYYEIGTMLRAARFKLGVEQPII